MRGVPIEFAEAPSGSAEQDSFGSLEVEGFRITRCDEKTFAPAKRWFDPQALVLCLNVAGRGQFQAGQRAGCDIEAGSMILSAAPRARQSIERLQGDRHRFVTMEIHRVWMKRWLPANGGGMRVPVSQFLKPGRTGEAACEMQPMTAQISQLAADIFRPPKALMARACWHQGKALEIASHVMFVSEEAELFCERTKRVGRERVARVQEILLADLEHPPTLADLGRQVGCSPFYLSRIFRRETGMTISGFLRRARMEHAAGLLHGGHANVTEAAMTVGYSSLSHFSKAFAETFGCCPCLYGRKA